MKKIINILGVSVLLLMFGSCQDWLDMPSDSKADSSTIFSTVSRAEMTVVGAYPYLYTQELGYQLLMGTDESSSTESNSKYNVANYDYTNLTGMLSSTYTTMYQAIEYSNVCIKNLPSMNVSESERTKVNSLLGEAYAIRAYAYWNIVRFYGDVPYTDIPTSDLTTFSSSRVSRDTIWDHCVADLQKAVELLPWKSEGMVKTAERFTKNSAYGILARVALSAAGYSLRWDLGTVPYNKGSVKIAQRDNAARIRQLYQIAADACAAVIAKNENSLLGNYDQVFRDLALKQYNNETMLEYGCVGANAPDVRTGYVNGVPVNGTSAAFGKGGPQMIVMPTLYFEFDEGDQRRDVSVCNYGILSNDNLQMSTYLGACLGKYRIDWKSERGTSDSKRDINFPLLRYSDVLLMYAEALNELDNGPKEKAINALKAVRLRAFKNDASKVGTIPSGYSNFKDAIIQERKLELSNESLRKSDLTRWGILYEHLTAEKAKLFQLARREGKYRNVGVYRAYKTVKGVFKNPVVAVPYISMSDGDIASLNLTAVESTTLNTLNASGKGYLDKTLYENKATGQVYYTQSAVPEGAEVTAVSYTILNMFGCHSVKQIGGLSLENVEGLASVNTWIQEMFYGMQKNMVEILPFNTTNIIDVNPGLTQQQHPSY
ncbi:SusD-like starch-binding protein associating with outer membrane [Dysgonomonas alginatilytica]|uniref:SusD-like starch-binding protein associating with outer membrane n=1 Tax=Dysgonomonas alginatilytica TaxID=1605892 RepID=A0A2V3PQN1_9BACT|nr:RagB/SusD family nutrient uptake outer membrane protein [Dysgonomonas alginatilytica]PXV66254.1 SusD-like starch-binding protein associating with outer membrane [Dysgonomonas alginatilytica]